MSNILTVFGATGKQGGSLIDFILQHPKLSSMYSPRGITRDITKAAAVALKEKGVEIVKADMDDKGSLEKAVAGSYAVFAMTNCMPSLAYAMEASVWDHGEAAREIAQGKAIADAAIAANVKLLIWSSLPDVTSMTLGRLQNVRHFDSKAEVETYIRGLDILCAFYMPGFYMQNFETVMKPVFNPANGQIEYIKSFPPTVSLPLIDITDTGKFIAPVLLSQQFDPYKYNHARLTAATAYYSGTEIVDALTRVTGRQVVYVQRYGAEHPGMTEEMKKTMKESAGLLSEWEYFGPSGRSDLEQTLAQMTDEPNTFEEYVKRVEATKGGFFG